MHSPGGPALALDPFQQAVAHFQAGRMAEAERLLRQCLAAEPRRGEALELLGGALQAQGRAPEALEWYDRAKAERPAAASLRHNRAQALAALGRLDEALAELAEAVRLKPDLHQAWTQMGSVRAARGEPAEAERAYRKALAIAPNHPGAHYNLALLLQESGRLDEAVAAYRRALALAPGFAAAHNNLANALVTLGRAHDALGHYEQAVRLDPQLADAQSNFGNTLRELGRVEEAIPLLERAAALKPGSAAVQNNLGIAYFARNRFEEAAARHRRALELAPAFHEARNNLGNALAALGREEEAIACFEQVIAQAPAYPDAHSNLGLLLQERGEVERATRCYERALELRPDHADAINNLGYLLQEQGRRDEAMDVYRRAMAANPQAARPAYNLGLAHLCRGEFEEGWRLCELRYATIPPVVVMRPFAIPKLTRADLGQGRRVAVWREQGIGDQLLYSTLVPELAGEVAGFVLEADARLVGAFRRAHPDWDVVSPEESDRAFAGCDRHLAVASLSGLFRTTRESFDRQPRALLAADPARAAAFRGRLATAGRRLVGVSWRSFQPAARGYLQRKKSAPLAAFAPLSRRDDVTLLDLQYGDTAAERAVFAQAGGRLERLDGLDLFNDLEGVFAAVEACDLVVTTSNVTAHFAGVLGKRAFLVYLGDNPPFHYWATDASGRCLWYPAITIVTGRALDTWDKALARIDELLDA